MRHPPTFLLALVLAAAGAAPGSAVSLPPGFQESVVLGGLTEPTAVRFSPDGRIFVAEKSGLVKVFHGLGDDAPTVFADLRTNVHNYFDRGLLGLALHPNFPATPDVYVLYVLDAPIGGTPPVYGTAGATSDGCDLPDGCVVADRVSRLEATGDVMAGSEHVLVEGWCQWYPSHSGGGLAFGSDGALYVGGGEGATATSIDYGQRNNACGDPPLEGGALRAQDLRTPGDPVGLSGSIIRIDPETGQALPDNPLAGQPGDRIIAYGLRNPFRMAFRPGTHELWIGDVGWEDWEEIDRIGDVGDRVVENFGWPCYEGSPRQPGYEAAALPICEGLYADAANGAVTAPYLTYRHGQPIVPGEDCDPGSSAISGLAFAAGGNYPSPYDHALFFADYARTCIWTMPAGPSGDPDPAAVATFASGAAFPVDLQIGPGGDLFYVDVVGGTVRRIQYFPGNQPPHAVIDAQPTNGPLPLVVLLDASASSDPDSTLPLSFSWDLDGNGQYGDATSATVTHVYSTAGTYDARVRVTDADGASATAHVAITAGNSAPVPRIDSPPAGLLWSVGDQIAFAGAATDAEDGPLPASALSWSLVLHHCPADCHTHPIRDFLGVAQGSFTTIDHDYPSYLELRLTATDSGGLEGTTSTFLQPRTVGLALVSNPPGLQLAIDATTAPAPFSHTAIIGSEHSVSAPAHQMLAGTPYEFLAWSDGGAATHDVVAPAAPLVLVARFLPPPGAAACTGACGDGRADPPCELCDLGAANCAPGSCCAGGCTSDCRPAGRCTASGACCATAADCPAGEGCCGNGRREAAEACDDGNLLDGDCCSSRCAAEAPGCEPETCPAVGPHLFAATGMTARIADVRSQRWWMRGGFTPRAGEAMDPHADAVTLTLAHAGRPLYEETLGAGAFRQIRTRCPRKWTSTAKGRALLRQGRTPGSKRTACDGPVTFAFAGRAGGASAAPPPRLRATLRIGDDCATAVLECAATRRPRGFACQAR